MTSISSSSPTEENNGGAHSARLGELPVLDSVGASKLLERSRKLLSSVQGALSKNVDEFLDCIEPLLNPPSTDEESTQVLAAVGLTSREAARCVAEMEDAEMRQRVACKLKPYLCSKSNSADLCELFEISSLDDLDDDDKGDIADISVVRRKTGSRYMRSVCYLRGAIIRKSGRYTLLIASYSRQIDVPWFSVAALLETDNSLQHYMKVMMMLATDKLHKSMIEDCPTGIVQARIVDDATLASLCT